MQNSIIFEGLVTKVAELVDPKKTNVKFKIQNETEVTLKNGTSFTKKANLRIDVWDKRLIPEAMNLQIGDRVCVTGALEYFTFLNAKGETVFLFKIKADSIDRSGRSAQKTIEPERSSYPVNKPKQQWPKVNQEEMPF